MALSYCPAKVLDLLRGFLLTFPMQIRRTILLNIMGDKAAQKAVSLLLLLKSRIGRTSSIKGASVNKIAALSGTSPSTIKKYIHVWEEMRLVEWQGSNGNVLIIRRLASKTHHRNVEVDKLNYKTFKMLYKTLRSLLFLILNSHKRFIERLLRTATDPQHGEDYKKARKLSEYYARRDADGVFRYKEYGLSYKTIAKKLGYCARTAEEIVKFALKLKWCRKTTRFLSQFMPNVRGLFVEGYTFTTKDHGYKVLANTYSENRYWYGILLDGKK